MSDHETRKTIEILNNSLNELEHEVRDELGRGDNK